VRYVHGRIRSAYLCVRELNALGEKILEPMPADKAAECLVLLESIRAEVVPLKMKLEKITG
jgi:hypothetical protein